jgi:acetyl esterase/lipase
MAIVMAYRIVVPTLLLAAAIAAAQQQVIPLYPGPAPGSENWDWPETEQPRKDEIRRLANIVKPTLTVYRPEQSKANGTAVVVAPGGGFMILAINHEGEDVARWLNEQGVTAFVLKYRVMRTGDEGQKDKAEFARRRNEAMALGVADGLRAVELVRSRAAEWGIRTDRIGILGFSAGGYVTAGVALQGRGLSRPDFAVPIYPYTQGDLTAPPQPMPLLLIHADDDKGVPVFPHSIRLYEAWKKAGAPVELHIYAKGGHGFGMLKKGLPVDSWPDRLRDWMASLGLLAR